jgi:hypothetical protein
VRANRIPRIPPASPGWAIVGALAVLALIVFA